MHNDLEEVMRRHRVVLEIATGRTAGEQQLRAALALCDASQSRRVVAHLPAQEDALLVAGLAAVALAEREGQGVVHLATRNTKDAERLAQAFQVAGLTERIRVAPAEKLAFEYMETGGTGATSAPVVVVIDADQTLVRDANTPLVLASIPAGTPDPPRIKKKPSKRCRMGGIT